MASATANTGRMCPSGRHVMDPNWDVCPYCEGEKKSHQQTAFREPEIIKSASSRKTSIGGSSPKSHRETKPISGQTPKPISGGYGGRGDTRRIVGVLITYTWHPQGDLFPVREGKNYIGAGYVSREPGDPLCDIYITEDPKLSSAHALILCRHGVFEIVDQESSNGTFIDDEMIPIRGESLPDKAIIKTGSTTWVFMKIDPLKSEIPIPPEEPVVEEPKHRRPTTGPQ